MSKLLETNWRVYAMPEPLRAKLKSRGDITLQVFLKQAMETLPRTIKDLKALGIEAAGETRPMKLPLDDSIIADLQSASEEIGLSQSLLFLLTLSRFCGKVSPKSSNSKTASNIPKVAHSKRKTKETPRKRKGGAK